MGLSPDQLLVALKHQSGAFSKLATTPAPRGGGASGGGADVEGETALVVGSGQLLRRLPVKSAAANGRSGGATG